MPKYLKKFLEGLTDEQADELWLYFDGCDNFDLIEAICNSHPALKAKQEANPDLILNSALTPGPIL